MTAKMRHCWFCGEELGVSAYHDKWDTCGKPECDRETRGGIEAERDDAHRQLDDDMGW